MRSRFNARDDHAYLLYMRLINIDAVLKSSASADQQLLEIGNIVHPSYKTFIKSSADSIVERLRGLDGCLDIEYNRGVGRHILRDRAFVIYMSRLSILLDEHKVRRPGGIPLAWYTAYRAALEGRQYSNETKIPYVTRGHACTASEAFAVLPHIDALLGTNLQDAFDAAYAKVKPFPFTSLPAELRLQVYSCLLPPAPRVTIYRFNYSPKQSLTPPKPQLPLFAVSRQLHTESTKCLYSHTPLFICGLHGSKSQPLSLRRLNAAYDCALRVPANFRPHFRSLEIQIMHISGRYAPLPSEFEDWKFSSTAPAFAALLSLFPNLDSVTMSIAYPHWGNFNFWTVDKSVRAARWILKHVPRHFRLSIDFRPVKTLDERDLTKLVSSVVGHSWCETFEQGELPNCDENVFDNQLEFERVMARQAEEKIARGDLDSLVLTCPSNLASTL